MQIPRSPRIPQQILDLIEDVDSSNLQLINFAQLGRILVNIGIFKSLKFNQQFILEFDDLDQISPQDKQRKILEISVHENIWKILSQLSDDEQYTSPENIKLILAVLENKYSLLETSEYIKEIINMKGAKNIDETDIQQLILNWKKLQSNKQFECVAQINEDEYMELQNQSFQKLNKSSFKYSQSSRSSEQLNSASDFNFNNSQKNLQFYQRTSQNQKNLQAKIREIKIQKEIQEMEQCTFKPVLKQKIKKNQSQKENIVNRLYQIDVFKKKEILQKQAKEQKEEEDIQQCTFRPQINRSQSPLTNICVNQINGYNEAIERVRYGHSIHEEKKYKIQHVPTGENYQKMKCQNFNPPSLLLREKKQKKQPYKVIIVNIGGGKKGKIALYDDSDIQQLLNNFSKAYQLQNEMRIELKEMLQKEVYDHQSFLLMNSFI